MADQAAFACPKCPRSFDNVAALNGHLTWCGRERAKPPASDRQQQIPLGGQPPAAAPPPYVVPFAEAPAAAPPPRPVAAPPPPPPPSAASAYRYVGRVPLPEDRPGTPPRDADDKDEVLEAEVVDPPKTPSGDAPAADAPKPPPANGTSLARLVSMTIDSHFGDVRRLNSEEKQVIVDTFPPISLAGKKGMSVVLSLIVLPRVFEHPIYRAEIWNGLKRFWAWLTGAPTPATAKAAAAKPADKPAASSPAPAATPPKPEPAARPTPRPEPPARAPEPQPEPDWQAEEQARVARENAQWGGR